MNLNEMQKAGEEIYVLPVSEEEMKHVVDSIDKELPEAQ